MGDEQFVSIAAKEGDNDNIMELPCDDEGRLLLSTVQAQFPFAIGLKYRSSSGGWRGVKAENNTMDPPPGGWEDKVYIITESEALKRKSTEGDSGGQKKSRKSSSKLLEDLIVLGIPFSTTQEELYQYFNDKCGETTFCELKLDRETKKSRGFGFIRFGTEEGAQQALNGYHEMEGRKLEVRLGRKKEEVPIKLFVGRLIPGTTKDDVEDYFSDFGDLTDVFVPEGRGFAFVTFADQEDGNKVLRLDHTLKGGRLNVTPAIPKEDASEKKPENFGTIEKDPYARVTQSYQQPQQQEKSNDVASELKDMLLQLIAQR